MRKSERTLALFLTITVAAPGLPPEPLARALAYLRDQKSYSWEVINADPGPVKQQHETRRGPVITVQQNLSPNIKGAVDRAGNIRLERTWPDGLTLETIATPGGGVVTRTPEGWMTSREILTALAEERLHRGESTVRHAWLRRADRPDTSRPDEELVPFLGVPGPFEESGASYVVAGRIAASDSKSGRGEDAPPGLDIVVTLYLRGCIIRDYEVKTAGVRRVTPARIQVPISDHRVVILTYLPINRIDMPEEARLKLDISASTSLRRRLEAP